MSSPRTHHFPQSKESSRASSSSQIAWVGTPSAEITPAKFAVRARSAAHEESKPPPVEAPPPPPKPVAPPPPPPLKDDPRVREFVRAATELAVLRAQIIATLEAEVLDLSIAIASAIVERELELDPALHGRLAKQALTTLGSVQNVRLRASRDAYSAILDVYETPSITVDGIVVQVILDPSIDGVGCIAENEHEHVDGRIEERLRAVRRAIEDERRRGMLEEGE